MNKFFAMVIFLMLISFTNIHAQIFECIMVDNPKLGLQFAKYKFQKLRSQNGTIYTNAGEDDNTVAFAAVTDLGIEIIKLEKKSFYDEGIEVYNAISRVSYKNGMNTGNLQMICYDLLSMNKHRAKKGGQQSPVNVKDW